MSDLHTTMLRCLQQVLRPVVRFCLSRSLGLNELIDVARIVFVEVAEEELERRGEKVNNSRVSAFTGVDRRAVQRIRETREQPDTTMHFAVRVIGQWRRDQRFTDKAGRPRMLSLGGPESEFNELVRSISTTLHPRSTLAALEQVSAVEIIEGKVKLKKAAYIPKGRPVEGFQMLAEDVEDFMSAVSENIFYEGDPLPNFHGQTHYDNIAEEDLPKIRDWLFKQCSNFHHRVDRYLSAFDIDIQSDQKKGKKDGGGCSVVYGSFSHLKGLPKE